MHAVKVRGKSELRVSTYYPNEVESMLENMPTCVVSDSVQVWNNNREWVFWVRLPNDKLTSSLRGFLNNVNMEKYHD